MEKVKIEIYDKDPTINLALDIIKKGKQALIFVATKKSAEVLAEAISKKLEKISELKNLSNQILNVLGKPTMQCKKLSSVVEKGVAFHHAGLHPKQRILIEENFRNRKIKIICCTPTLAYGVDLPAFRVIIRDVKRFVRGFGAMYIPALEWLQMAGRAGRPRFDRVGEAISIARTKAEKADLVARYILGEPEEIISKLAVEPILRVAILSLISIGIVENLDQALEFFSKTFWGFTYKDFVSLRKTLKNLLKLLIEWEFVQELDGRLRATILGKRVSELYIDPLTAFQLIRGLKRMVEFKTISILHLISSALELKPLLTVRAKEFENLILEATKAELLIPKPSEFEADFEDWLGAFKTAKFFHEWIEEIDEQRIFENYGLRPGETRAKLEIADWLLYALSELARLEKIEIKKEISGLRIRMLYGVKEELLELVGLEGVGRVRARILFNAGVKTLKDLKLAPVEKISLLLGPKLAKSLKEQINVKY